MKKNWLTTIFGLVAGGPKLLQAVGILDPHTADTISSIGIVLLGGAAKDWRVTGGTVRQDRP